MLADNSARRSIIYLAVAVSFAFLGYGVARIQIDRDRVAEHAASATAELWYFYEALQAHEMGDPQALPTAVALKAEMAVSTIAEAEHLVLGSQQREFQTRVLTEYKGLRDRHPELYVLPADLASTVKEEWVKQRHSVSEYLKRVTVK